MGFFDFVCFVSFFVMFLTLGLSFFAFFFLFFFSFAVCCLGSGKLEVQKSDLEQKGLLFSSI